MDLRRLVEEADTPAGRWFDNVVFTLVIGSIGERRGQRTVTSTCAVVQQHWSPPPPLPETSFAVTSSRYSPGSVKVA